MSNVTVTLINNTTAIINHDGSVSFDGGKSWSYWSNIINGDDIIAYLKREGKLAM